MLPKLLIKFSVDGWSLVPSLLFDLRPDYGGGDEDNGELLQIVPCIHCGIQCPQPCSGPPPTHASAGDSWTLTGQSGSVPCGVPAPFSWILVQGYVCASKGLFPPSCVSSGSSMVELMVTSSKRAYAIPKAAAFRASVPSADHCRPAPPQEMLKHSSVSVSVGSLGPGAHKVCLSSLSISGRNGVSF